MPAKDLSTSQMETLRKLKLQLSEEFRRAGRGSRNKALRSIGIVNSTLENGFAMGHVKIGLILQILDELGVSPEDFFFDAFDLRRHKPRLPEATDPGLIEIRKMLREREGS